MSRDNDHRLARGCGVPFWPSNEKEWEYWHARNAAAIRVIQDMNLSDLDEHTILDAMGLLPEQLAERENHMRMTRTTPDEVRARPKLLGRRAPAQNRNH
jgi:hypothetical protein